MVLRGPSQDLNQVTAPPAVMSLTVVRRIVGDYNPIMDFAITILAILRLEMAGDHSIRELTTLITNTATMG